MKDVVVFFGLTASGKSYLAKRWSERNGYPYFNTDVIRKSLAGLDAATQCNEPLSAGIYSSEYSRRTYDTLLELAFKAGEDKSTARVVLDGSFQNRVERRKVCERFLGISKVYFVLCRCAENITKKRLLERVLDPAAVSDGRWDIYLQQKKKFDKPNELSPEQLLELDTNASLEYLIDRLEIFLSMPGRENRKQLSVR
jgi:predicted kinase